MDFNSKELFLEILSSLWLRHSGKSKCLKVKDVGQQEGFSTTNMIEHLLVAEPCGLLSQEKNDLLYLILNMGSNYPDCLWFQIVHNDKQCIVSLLKNKLIGSKEFQRVPAAPTLNKRCPQDPNKNGNYNVFVMEMRMPKKP